MAVETPAALRQVVAERAHGRCEYCRLSEALVDHPHEPDHIIPKQHQGETSAENLALACFRCNRYKGPNVGSFDPETGELVRFYNPRHDSWHDHFRLEESVMQPRTPQARVTVMILRLNDAGRITERRRLLTLGLYP